MFSTDFKNNANLLKTIIISKIQDDGQDKVKDGIKFPIIGMLKRKKIWFENVLRFFLGL